MRVGMGYDVHKLTEGRKLILGGAEIPFEKGLLGHSDADVVVHAIMDALLGAAALGDIGKHFPDTDPAYKGISSIELLRHVGKLLDEKNYVIENIDATIIAQRPKLRPYIEEMEQNVAAALQIEKDQVNIKATTEEGLGFTGTGEGISSQAICALIPLMDGVADDRMSAGCEAAEDAAENMKHEVKLLSAAENEKTRALYERVFSEDSQAFVDYYYRCKTRENRIYAIEEGSGQIVSMLHLNPYLMKLGVSMNFGEYIVAVATDEKYRHQGMMRSVIVRALTDMRWMGEPLTFLMPAAEAIYRPFDFRFIYSQNQSVIRPGEFAGAPGLTCRAAAKEDLEGLAEFANAYLERRYACCAIHDKEYLETVYAEQRSQNGEIVLLLEGEKIRGYFFSAMEETAEVREPVIAEGYEKYLIPSIAGYLNGYDTVKVRGCSPEFAAPQEQKPMIMARMVTPESFLAGLTAEETTRLCFELRDDLLPQNEGIYEACLDEEGCRVQKCDDAEAEFTVSAGDLTELAFGSMTAEEAGMPEKAAGKWKKVRMYAPAFLNEVV